MDIEKSLQFIHENLSLPSGRTWGQAAHADPWIEQRILRPILETTKDGLPANRWVWIELARGHGKTSICGGISMLECLRGDDTQTFAVACDKEQAGILLEVTEGFRFRNKALGRLFRQTQTDFKVPSTHSSLRIMAADAPSFYGVGASAQRLRFVLDEMSQWPKRDLYDAAVTSMAKVPNSQLIIISNSGLVDTWQHLERLSAEQNGFYLFSHEGTLASWITEEQLAEIRSKVPEDVYRRFHLNQWVEHVGGFLTAEAWDACLGHVPELKPEEEVVLGVDAGIVSDNFVVLGVTRDTRPERQADSIMIRGVKAWQPSKTRPINFQAVHDWLAEFCQTYNVIRIAYDPYQLTDLMQRFNTETGVWCKAFQQGPARLRSDTDLLRLIQQKRLTHSGEPLLREHVLNAALKMNVREDSAARIIKKSPQAKVDAVVALSMAASECLRMYL